MKNVEVLEFNNWSKIIEYYRKEFPPNGQWIFRGHTNEQWSLKTTLERTLDIYKIPLDQASNMEMQILRDCLIS